MKNKFISFVSSCVILGLLVAGSIFNVEWALTTVQVIYWALYPIAILTLLALIWFLVDRDDDGEIAEKVAVSVSWYQWITFPLIVGLMIYAGLVALPVVVVLTSILTHITIHVARESLKDE